MKNIVVVSGTRIFPAVTGGQVHSISIARALARIGYTVDIVSIAGRREDYSRKSLFHGATSTRVIEPRLRETTDLGLLFGFIQSAVRRLDYPRLWQYEFLKRGLVPKSVKQALKRADIILSDFPYCSRIPGPWGAKPWFLISHNLEFKLLEQGSEREKQFAARMKRIETAAPSSYTDIFACAEEDRDFYRALDPTGRLALPIIRCGVDPQAYSFSVDVRNRMRSELRMAEEDWLLVFSGSGFGPNVEAFKEIEEFCRTEAEFLALNRVYFLVVGSVSPVSRRNGALIVAGRVEEILPYFACADAGINLINRGSGSNVKLFEYLAAKLPVISTIFGVRGTKLEAHIDYVPCSRENLKEVIQKFIATDKASWRARAEAVWERHYVSCDIQFLVRDAISAIAAFQA